MTTVPAVILAAGPGKRMKSKRAKVLHRLAGRPMILYSVETARRLPSDRILVVVGHQAEWLKEVLEGRPVEIVHQDRPLGTGHAVLQVKTALSDYKGPVLILNADVPLITVDTLRSLVKLHRDQEADVTLLTATLSDAEGYGRILREPDARKITGIVEETDATPAQRSIREINAGFYVMNAPFVFEALAGLKAGNTQQEYYLTDIVGLALREDRKVCGMAAVDSQEIMGVNTRVDLARTEKAAARQIAQRHMLEGVTLLDPETTWIEAGVTIGRDTVIYPEVRLEGPTRIGEDCVIHSHSRISDCRLGNGVTVEDSCVLSGSVLEDGSGVGPFAHLRPGTVLHKGAKLGNFVETKKADIGEGSKAKHLTYLGDAMIGKDVNIGAGTIICNYDGVSKHTTLIEDGVFIGSDTQLVAPVRIGQGAFVGAGSTITEDVPPDALAISRTNQKIKKDWAKKRKKKKGAQGRAK
jgi:bifunctional UDP-N-acetylglucosamine pyrophosphorylase / glucosamine-1-phosphate N-acetyltransferase